MCDTGSFISPITDYLNSHRVNRWEASEVSLILFFSLIFAPVNNNRLAAAIYIPLNLSKLIFGVLTSKIIESSVDETDACISHSPIS